MIRHVQRNKKKRSEQNSTQKGCIKQKLESINEKVAIDKIEDNRFSVDCKVFPKEQMSEDLNLCNMAKRSKLQDFSNPFNDFEGGSILDGSKKPQKKNPLPKIRIPVSGSLAEALKSYKKVRPLQKNTVRVSDDLTHAQKASQHELVPHLESKFGVRGRQNKVNASRKSLGSGVMGLPQRVSARLNTESPDVMGIPQRPSATQETEVLNTDAMESHQQFSASHGVSVGHTAASSSHQQPSGSQNNSISTEEQSATSDSLHLNDVDGSVMQTKNIFFNENAQPIGEDSSDFSTKLGRFVRDQCPIYYDDWRDVPYEYKESVINLMKTEGYEIPQHCIANVIKRMDHPWRSYKYRLRNLHYDRYDTVVEKKNHCPIGVDSEDWKKFVDMQLEVDYKREKTKKARACVKSPHTSGRRGAARTAEILKHRNPNAALTRTDIYMATHCGKDGSAPTAEAYEQIQKIRAIVEKNPSSTKFDVDHDPVAQVCGPDGKGSVRGMGAGVTKSSLRNSAFARAQLHLEKRKRVSLENKVIAQGKLIEDLRSQLIDQGKMIADVCQRVVSQEPQSRFSNDSIRSNVRVSDNLNSPLIPNSPTALYLQSEQPCELLVFGGEIAANGRALRECLAGDGGSQSVAELYEIIIDVIHEPSTPLFSTVPTSSCLGDVGEGSTIAWPKIFTRLL